MSEQDMYDGLQTVESENKENETGGEEEGKLKRVWYKLSRTASYRSQGSRRSS